MSDYSITDKENAIKGVIKALESFFDESLPEAKIKEWFKTLLYSPDGELNNITPSQYKIGLTTFFNDHKRTTRFPSALKIKLYCIGDNSGIQESNAFNLFVDSLSTGKIPIFKDRSISEAIRNIGGWNYVKKLNDNQLTFLDKDFKRHYRKAKEQNVKFDNLVNIKPTITYYQDNEGKECQDVTKKDPEKYCFVGDFSDQEKQEIAQHFEKTEYKTINHAGLRQVKQLTKQILG